MRHDRGSNVHRRRGGPPPREEAPRKSHGHFRPRPDASRESWERGGRLGDDPPQAQRDRRAPRHGHGQPWARDREHPEGRAERGRWPEAFGMHEEDRGHHAGLPQRRPPRESRGFAGRGPKGYQRSDERIREDVCERLTADDDVDASDVTVAVQDGEVTLEGSVADRRMRRDAEACADEVTGVREIHNRLQVRAGGAT